MFSCKHSLETGKNGGAVDWRQMFITCSTDAIVVRIFKFRSEREKKKQMFENTWKHERKHGRVEFHIRLLASTLFACQKIDMNGLNFTCHHPTFRVLSFIFCILYSFAIIFFFLLSSQTICTHEKGKKKAFLHASRFKVEHFFVLIIGLRVLMTQATCLTIPGSCECHFCFGLWLCVCNRFAIIRI